MYMIEVRGFLEFEWDEGNIHKSYMKHGILPNEAEEIFVDNHVIVYDDKTHSVVEKRFVAVGKSKGGKLLFIIYTMRKEKIRVISARPADKKERRLYEKTKTNTTL